MGNFSVDLTMELLMYRSILPYEPESPVDNISSPVCGVKTKWGSLVALLPDKPNKW